MKPQVLFGIISLSLAITSMAYENHLIEIQLRQTLYQLQSQYITLFFFIISAIPAIIFYVLKVKRIEYPEKLAKLTAKLLILGILMVSAAFFTNSSMFALILVAMGLFTLFLNQTFFLLISVKSILFK